MPRLRVVTITCQDMGGRHDGDFQDIASRLRFLTHYVGLTRLQEGAPWFLISNGSLNAALQNWNLCKAVMRGRTGPMHRVVHRRAGMRQSWLRLSDRTVPVSRQSQEARNLRVEILRLTANRVMSVECTFCALLEHIIYKS